MRSALSRVFLIDPGAGYDERQELARLRAWRAACVTLAGCALIFMLFLAGNASNIKSYGTFTVFLAIWLSLGLALTVFEIYSIFADAYAQLKQDGRALVTWRLILVLAWSSAGLLGVFGDNEYMGPIYLPIVLYNVIVLIALAIKLGMERGKGKTEGDK